MKKQRRLKTRSRTKTRTRTKMEMRKTNNEKLTCFVQLITSFISKLLFQDSVLRVTYDFTKEKDLSRPSDLLPLVFSLVCRDHDENICEYGHELIS